MKRHLLLLLLVPFFFVTSCSKDDEEEEELHKMVGTWRVNKYESRTGTGNWQNANQSCRLDNTEEYEADGSWTLYDGTNQCGAGTGITKGTWRTAASDTKVIYTYTGISGEYESTIEELTATTLVLTNSVGDVANTQTRVTYQKQ
ncbi:MAG: lipocalin family protein [Rufibacter sp.]